MVQNMVICIFGTNRRGFGDFFGQKKMSNFKPEVPEMTRQNQKIAISRERLGTFFLILVKYVTWVEKIFEGVKKISMYGWGHITRK